MTNKTKSYFFLLFAIFCLLFLYESPQKLDINIEKITSQYDLKPVTAELAFEYCDKVKENNIPQSVCLEYFRLASEHYFSSDLNYKVLFDVGLKDAIQYINNIATGKIVATTPAEQTFIRQYNPWLIEISNLYILHNYLSPLNLNLMSLLKSFTLSNSFYEYLIHLVILFFCIFYLQRFFSLRFVLIGTIATLLLSTLISCLYLSRPSSYVLSSCTFSLTGLALILGSCIKHKISKIHNQLIVAPLNYIPLAIPIIISMLYFVILTISSATVFQTTPLLPVIVIGLTLGIIIKVNFPFPTIEEYKNLMMQKDFNSKSWKHVLDIHHDDLIYYQCFANSIFEKEIHGLTTSNIKEELKVYLPRYFKILSLEQEKETFLKELAKASAQFDISMLCSSIDSSWIDEMLKSNQIDLHGQMAIGLQTMLQSRKYNSLNPRYLKASRSRRFFAFMIDLILYAIAFKIVERNLSYLLETFSLDDQHLKTTERVANFITLSILVIPALLMWNATMGKKILSIKIAHANHSEKVSWWQLLGREFLGKPISSFLFFGGYLLILFPGKKTLHDLMFATTVVVEYKDNP